MKVHIYEYCEKLLKEKLLWMQKYLKIASLKTKSHRESLTH